METTRAWFCTCRGTPLEMVAGDPLDEEDVEPTCPRCGATPSNDPHKTVVYRDLPADD